MSNHKARLSKLEAARSLSTRAQAYYASLARAEAARAEILSKIDALERGEQLQPAERTPEGEQAAAEILARLERLAKAQREQGA